MSPLETFDIGEISQLKQTAEFAEDAVSDYFRLTSGFWVDHPVELKTGAELEPGEVSHSCLAQVMKMRTPPSGGRLRARDFYRICVQDHNLLELMRREGGPELMSPLMMYVMVHEMVHVVRFAKHLHLFEADLQQRLWEEAKVHDLSARLLGRLNLPGLGRVLELYERRYAGVVDFAQGLKPRGYEQCRSTSISAIAAAR